MKAWKVGTEYIDGVFLIHADSRGKAKWAALKHTDLREWDPEFADLRARRVKVLDDRPFTVENAEEVLDLPDAIDEDGQPYSGEYCTREDYENQCPCDICKAANT